jgi:hypothetical protein
MLAKRKNRCIIGDDAVEISLSVEAGLSERPLLTNDIQTHSLMG